MDIDFDSEDFKDIFGEEENSWLMFENEMEDIGVFSSDCEIQYLIEHSSESFDSASLLNKRKPSAQKTQNTRKLQKRFRSVAPEIIEQWKLKRHLQLHTPRLLKNDSRKDYILMLTNVMNSTDFERYYSYLTTYCTDNLVQKQSFYRDFNGTPCPEMPRHLQFTGIINSAQHWYNSLVSMPDVVIKLLSGKLHLYSDTKKSKLVAHYEIKATHLFDVKYDVVIPHNTLVISQDNKAFIASVVDDYSSYGNSEATSTNNSVTSATSATDSTATMMNSNVSANNSTTISHSQKSRCGHIKSGQVAINRYINHIIDNCAVLSNPLSMSYNVKVVLYIDERKFIEGIEVESVCVNIQTADGQFL